MTIFQNNGMKPTYIVTFALSCCSCGALLCVFAGSTHRQALSIAAVLLGIGTSDIILIFVKWVRRWRGLDMFGAAGVTSAQLGAELGAFLVGQFIEEYPDFLLWLVFGGVCTVVAGMTTIVFLARKCRQDELEVEEEESGAITEVSNECDSVPSNQEAR